MEEKKTAGQHRLELWNRKEGRLSGVRDVKSFDDRLILLATDAGMLTIKGENLHMSQLDLESGEVAVSGRVSSIVYSEKGAADRKETSLLGRMFG